ncbi:hypothetical protein [Basfia succiniciproducens]|uniref:hypothetical protein n=1 Tax=Basfia succiniciproducens TaxID=653940 RepID=UPI003FCCEFCD
MDKIPLSKATEDKIIDAALFHAVSNITTDSTALMDTSMIAAYFRRSYNYVANNIVKLPSFPKPVTISGNKKANPLYISGEVAKWLQANYKRLS